MRTADGRSIAIRNVIWDVDGTLFDTYPAIAHAFKAALNELGRDATLERITELARESLSRCAATLAADLELDPERFEAAFDRAYARVPAEDQPPFPGVREVCEHILAMGGRNVIVTHRGPGGTAELLAAGRLSGYFADCITHADGFPRKPDPAAFNAIIGRNGLDRDETMAIGDRDFDVEAGRAAGLVTCLFGPGGGSGEADLTIEGFGELLSLLRAPLGEPVGS